MKHRWQVHIRCLHSGSRHSLLSALTEISRYFSTDITRVYFRVKKTCLQMDEMISRKMKQRKVEKQMS